MYTFNATAKAEASLTTLNLGLPLKANLFLIKHLRSKVKWQNETTLQVPI